MPINPDKLCLRYRIGINLVFGFIISLNFSRSQILPTTLMLYCLPTKVIPPPCAQGFMQALRPQAGEPYSLMCQSLHGTVYGAFGNTCCKITQNFIDSILLRRKSAKRDKDLTVFTIRLAGMKKESLCGWHTPNASARVRLPGGKNGFSSVIEPGWLGERTGETFLRLYTKGLACRRKTPCAYTQIFLDLTRNKTVEICLAVRFPYRCRTARSGSSAAWAARPASTRRAACGRNSMSVR